MTPGRNRRGDFELISSIRLGRADGAWGKFEHRMREDACRQPPRTYVASNLSYSQVTVEVDQIDGELHANRMYGLTGQNPNAFPGQQKITPQQSFPARRTVGGEFHAGGELGLPSDVPNSEMHIRLRLATEIEANRHCLARKTDGSFYLAAEL
jgi:hypothetical protein